MLEREVLEGEVRGWEERRGRRGADRLVGAPYAAISLPFSLTEAPTVAQRLSARIQVLLVWAALPLMAVRPVQAQSLAPPRAAIAPALPGPAAASAWSAPQGAPVDAPPGAARSAPTTAQASPQVPVPVSEPTSAAPAGIVPAPVVPMEPGAFATLLRSGSLEQLDAACALVIDLGDRPRLRQLQQRLLEVVPWPQTLDEVLANADVLIRCRAPQAALTVLDRYGPGPGPGRVQWLLMQWRAASTALDHRRAALALERLTGNRPDSLAALALPLQRRPDGTVVTRPALDVLAGHLEARGFHQAAAAMLLAAATPGRLGAERVQQAVGLLQDLPPLQREELLETALNEAAAAGAWGLVTDLLRAQAALPGSRGRERLLRLSPRLDDAYGEWWLRRSNPADPRVQELERQLRAPDPLP